MRWELFNRVRIKVVGVRELDPQRDAAKYAEQLLSLHPRLFTRLEGGAESVAARMAARTIAVDHLSEVCALPEAIEALERSLSVATKSPGERLVRVAALAYLVCERDLIRDDLPAGYGLIDDCIALRGARLATPSVAEPDHLHEDLLEIRYLSVAVPDEVLAATEDALVHAADLALRASALPNHVVEAAIRELVSNPPREFSAIRTVLPESGSMAPRPATRSEPRELATLAPQGGEPGSSQPLPSPLTLAPGELVELDKDAMLFAFPDGTKLRRTHDGALSFE
ncbi:hypothetical protein ENSA5_65380 [Enhygromyxa salina]|uniref:Uncharacterized protein n=1 Tax=Enhygromyxa salina TaxID=215803 RepID=A0A2S9XCD7_9BACT|nr:hypothetical protein [Enhygromyxa salina]PRP90341.1 hypothetical protein ENSA5_65380 [Enhygromyxa salina]